MAASGRLRAHWALLYLQPQCADVSGAEYEAELPHGGVPRKFALLHNKTATVTAASRFGRVAIAVDTPIIRARRTRLTCKGASADDRGGPGRRRVGPRFD